jgi:ribosomal protein L40E
MTDTTCPQCNAPAPAGARTCSRCGYRFIEGGGGPRRARPRVSAVAYGAAALAAVAVAAVLIVSAPGGGGATEPPGEPVATHLQVLAKHPLATREAERLLEDRYFSIPNDDESDVHCSGRIPKPAHSVRRCELRYPGGTIRTVVVLTTANGAEVLSKP